MTPRQQAATAAMQGILASGEIPCGNTDLIAARAILLADVLLAGLGSTQDEFIQAQEQVIHRSLMRKSRRRGQGGEVTHEERATAIVEKWARQLVAQATNGGHKAYELLMDAISRGMAEASEAERQRKRVIEAERDHLRYVVGHLGEYRDSTWFREFLLRKSEWSAATFGLGTRTQGTIAHIRKELEEIEADPTDIMEWIDVCFLAMDGYWRQWMAETDLDLPTRNLLALAAGDFIHMMLAKQHINEARKWPAPGPEDQPTEHIREEAE